MFLLRIIKQKQDFKCICKRFVTVRILYAPLSGVGAGDPKNGNRNILSYIKYPVFHKYWKCTYPVKLSIQYFVGKFPPPPRARP